jgi:hypothetical protein
LERNRIMKSQNIPITSGGFADIYKGQYNNKKVALKVIRIYTGNAEILKKVQKVWQHVKFTFQFLAVHTYTFNPFIRHSFVKQYCEKIFHIQILFHSMEWPTVLFIRSVWSQHGWIMQPSGLLKKDKTSNGPNHASMSNNS